MSYEVTLLEWSNERNVRIVGRSTTREVVEAVQRLLAAEVLGERQSEAVKPPKADRGGSHDAQ